MAEMPAEVQQRVREMLELTPGVPAIDANVKKLAAWIRNRANWVHVEGNMRVFIKASGKKKAIKVVKAKDKGRRAEAVVWNRSGHGRAGGRGQKVHDWLVGG